MKIVKKKVIFDIKDNINHIKNLNKKFIFISLLMFSLFFLPSIMAGTVIVVAPANTNTTILIGNAMINATFVPANENWTRAQVYIQSAGGTANSSLIKINDSIATNKNLSGANGTSFNLTIPTAILQDGNDYTLTVNLWNGTNYLNGTVVVSISNGNPTATLGSSMIHNNYGVSGPTTFTTQIDADPDIGISNCTIIAENLNSLVTINRFTTASTDSCTNTTHTIANFGLSDDVCYNIYVQSSDAEGNKTNSTSRLLCTKGASGKLKTSEEKSILAKQPANKGQVISNFARNIGTTIREIIFNIINRIKGGA